MEVLLNNIKDVLGNASLRLEESNIEDARLNAELLICEVLKCSRMDLYLNFDKPLTDDEIDKFESLIGRRIKREPLQYILGRTDFFGYEIKVNKNVLIPRPETEILVERILEDIKSSGKNFVSVFEIGTGSGCIVIALAKELDKAGTGYKIISIDNSKDALETAKKNCGINNVDMNKVRLVLKDFFSIPSLKGNVDYIISNPPYISKGGFDDLQSEVKDHEPLNALTDSDDGLSYFRKIIELAGDDIFKGKIFCEIGYDQKEKLSREFKNHSDVFREAEFFKDLNGIDRIIRIEK